MNNCNDQYDRESFLKDILDDKMPVPWSKSTHQLTKHGVRFSDRWQEKFRERKALLKHMKAEYIVITLIPFAIAIPPCILYWWNGY